MRSLGEFEQLILWSVLRLGDDAYGVPIGREIEERTAKAVSPGALYTTLGRLEDRGLVTSRSEPGGASRSGRPRKYYRLSSEAAAELAASKARITAMADGQTEAIDKLMGNGAA